MGAERKELRRAKRICKPVTLPSDRGYLEVTVSCLHCRARDFALF
jgi:hypothetical protein